MKRTVVSLLALAIIAGTASVASAVPPILRPGTKPMWAGAGLGPVIKAKDLPTQFMLQQTFGYHFSGTATGPAIAIDLREGFGDNFITFQVMPRFVWDIQLLDGVGFYLSPSGGFGYQLLSFDGPSDPAHGFVIDMAIEGKLILGDMGYVFLRPFGMEISYGEICASAGPFGTVCASETFLRIEMMMIGGGITF